MFSSRLVFSASLLSCISQFSVPVALPGKSHFAAARGLGPSGPLPKPALTTDAEVPSATGGIISP